MSETIKQKRILVIEDEEPLRELYEEVFGRRGCTVETAEDGRIGFRMAATFDYDIIICDLHMPDWNGVESIKSILLVKPNCQFIVISGYADRKIADELRAIPAVLRIFEKPAELKEVAAVIAEVV